MRAALLAGVLYFATVFAVGFVLGALRGMVLVPLVGEVWAVAFELPVMLAVSWWACGRVVRRVTPRRAVGPRLMMGGLAFALMMLAELGVSVLLGGRSVSDHVGTYARLPNQLGLIAQVAFALMPVVRS